MIITVKEVNSVGKKKIIYMVKTFFYLSKGNKWLSGALLGFLGCPLSSILSLMSGPCLPSTATVMMTAIASWLSWIFSHNALSLQRTQQNCLISRCPAPRGANSPLLFLCQNHLGNFLSSGSQGSQGKI